MIIVVSLGSNTINKEMKIQVALDRLCAEFSLLHVSEIYSTPALNGVDAEYSNCVVSFCVEQRDFTDIQNDLKQIERELGRKPELKLKGIVPIDLDLVICDDVVLRPKDFGYDYFQIGWKEIKNRIDLNI